MAKVNELAVEYRKTDFNPDTHEVEAYWLEAFVPGREYTSFDFSLSPDGEFASGSKTFFELLEEDKEAANQLITFGKELIKKYISKL